MTDYPPLLIPSQACALGQFSRRTLSRMVRAGQIEVVYIGRALRIPRDKLLIRLGLLSKRAARRQDQQAQYEAHLCAAALSGGER